MLLRGFSPWYSPVLNALCTVTTAARFLFLQMFGSLPATSMTESLHGPDFSARVPVYAEV